MATTINGSAGVTTNSGAVYDGIQRGTAVTASGTSIDFTSIPSWVKRITVMLSGVSTSGVSLVQLQLGNGSVVTSGYSCFAQYSAGASGAGASYTSGFPLRSDSASNNFGGNIQITNLSSNTWTANAVVGSPAAGDICITGGYISLGGTLDRIRITTVNGTDTFDAGSINILYE